MSTRSTKCDRRNVKHLKVFNKKKRIIVKILFIGTDRSEQTVETQIRLLLKEQSDQGLHYLPCHVHLCDLILF